ncbi:hypothetical protein BpHYR1_039212 [Brachionus plicatilis]|uniref:Uncharacterized protein n=1 Tax=Brachionus plicatilis TaxID=10195 RepID=A0A3M7QVT2_BRAPC|nr:hypothetical protein BpHYR1_039212 [Brachionus plicatilis]
MAFKDKLELNFLKRVSHSCRLNTLDLQKNQKKLFKDGKNSRSIFTTVNILNREESHPSYQVPKEICYDLTNATRFNLSKIKILFEYSAFSIVLLNFLFIRRFEKSRIRWTRAVVIKLVQKIIFLFLKSSFDKKKYGYFPNIYIT